MRLRNEIAPAEVWQDQGEGEKENEQCEILDNKRSARRQRLSAHLHAAGPRPVLEALIAVHDGADLDEVLEDFGRIPVEVYRAVGASHFASLTLIDCGGGK